MSRRLPVSRRSFLKGAGAVLALPHLEALVPRGCDAAPPVRAAWLYIPNGVATGSWWPTGVDAGGAIARLNPRLAAFERFTDRLLFPRNVWTPRGNGHGAGTATWLTSGGWNDREVDAGGASVDQIAARELGDDCVVPALSLSARGEGFFAADVPRNSLSWAGTGRPVFRETDPRSVFRLLFGGGVEADRSLLDDLRTQAETLKRRVSESDAERLEAYLDAIRDLERRIAFVQDERTRARLESAREHGLPFDADAPLDAVPEEHGAYLDLMLDLAALALWSGASRVASVMLDHGQSNRYCTFVRDVNGVDEVAGTWHALSHWRDASGRSEDDDGVTSWSSVDSKRAMYDAVVEWHNQRAARFLERLDALPEVDGTLLDHALVMYGSSISDGHDHGELDLPVLLAGGAGGALRGGRVLDSGGRIDLASVHLAALRAMGSGAESFGEVDTPLALT